MGVVVEIEGPAVDRQRARRGQAAARAELQRAGADRRAAGIVVGAGQGQRAGPGLGQAAAAGDDAGIAGARALGDGQRPVAQVHRAARARERADGLGVVVEIEGPAVDLQRARGGQAAAGAQLQRFRHLPWCRRYSCCCPAGSPCRCRSWSRCRCRRSCRYRSRSWLWLKVTLALSWMSPCRVVVVPAACRR